MPDGSSSNEGHRVSLPTVKAVRASTPAGDALGEDKPLMLAVRVAIQRGYLGVITARSPLDISGQADPRHKVYFTMPRCSAVRRHSE